MLWEAYSWRAGWPYRSVTMEKSVYFGPGTPPNTDWHHYTWTLVATDLDPKALQPGLTREELAAALKDHVKGSAGLITRFKHA